MSGPSGFCLRLGCDWSTSLWGQELIRQERGAGRQSLLLNGQGFAATAAVPEPSWRCALGEPAHGLLRG